MEFENEVWQVIEASEGRVRSGGAWGTSPASQQGSGSSRVPCGIVATNTRPPGFPWKLEIWICMSNLITVRCWCIFKHLVFIEDSESARCLEDFLNRACTVIDPVLFLRMKLGSTICLTRICIPIHLGARTWSVATWTSLILFFSGLPRACHLQLGPLTRR